MASKKDIQEVDLTDFDDGFDDLFGGDDSKPLTRIEKAKRVSRGVKAGMIDALTSRDFILKTLNRALPSEYGIDTRVIEDTLNSVDELTREASTEAEKVNRALKDAARPLVEKYESKLPKGLRDSVKEYVASDDYGYGGLSQVNEEDDFVSNRLSELFATQAAREEIREEERAGKEAIQTELEHRHRKKTLLLSDSMRSSLERLVNFQDKVTSNFQRKSLEIGLRQYFVQTKMLEITKENAVVTQENLKSIYDAINTPDIVKLREHKDTRMLYGGSRGEKNLFGSVTGVADRIRENAQRRVKDAIQTTSMGLGMAIGMIPSGGDDFGFGDKYSERGRQGGRIGAEILGSLVGNQIRKRLQGNERAQGLGRRSAYFTSNFRNLLEEEHLNQDIEYDEKGREKISPRRTLARLLHSLVSDERGSGVLQTDSLETLQAPHPFTKQTNRTINEVIPGLLSMIHQSVEGLRTGEPAAALSYDYLKGRFVTEGTAAKRTVDSLLLKGRADTIQEDMNRLLDDIDSEGTLDQDDRLELATFLMRQSHDKRLGSQERLTNAGTFSQFSPEQAERFRSVFDHYFSNSDDPDRALEFSRRYNNLTSQSDLTRDDFHALLNTGQIRHLEEAGLVVNGRIDYDAIFRAIMTFDNQKAEDDLLAQTQATRQQQEEEDRKKLEDARRAAGFMRRGSEKLKNSKLGKRFFKEKSRATDHVERQDDRWKESTAYYRDRDDDVDPEVDPGSEHVAEEFRSVGDDLGDKINRILDTITEKFEYDRKKDEGPRRGSYEDIMASRAAKKKEPKRNDNTPMDEKESGFGLLATIASLISKFPGLGALAGLLTGGLGSAVGALGGLMGGPRMTINTPGAGGFAAGAGKAAKTAGGKAGGFMPRAFTNAAKSGGFIGKMARGAGTAARVGMKGAGMLGRGALMAAGMAGLPLAPLSMAGKTLMGVGKLGLGAAKLGVGAAKFAAPMVASGIMKALPLVTGPVGLAIGGAALAGYGAYKFFTRTKLTELNRIRLTQYGYGPEDLDAMKTMLAFESEVAKAVKLSPSGMPSIDESSLNPHEILKALGIKEDDVEAIERFQAWVGQRFLPTYLVHVGVLHRLTGQIDLTKIEDLKGDQILEYVKGVNIADGNYDGGLDPKTGTPLPANKETVTRTWEAARDYALSKAKKKPETETGKVDAKSVGGLAETGESTGDTESRSDQPEEAKEGGGFFSKAGDMLRKAVSFTPFGLAAKLGERFAKGVKDTITGQIAHARQSISELRAIDSVRFKLYGLREMNAEKISTLLSLEHLVAQELEFDSDGKATWEGRLEAIVHEFSGRFGVIPDTEDADNLKDWLAYRFLPVFTRGMSFLYSRVKATSMAEGLVKINATDRLELAYEILSTMTVHNDDTISVWLYPKSPWLGEEINTDHTTVDENLAVLRNESKNVVLPEKKVVDTTKKSDATSSPSLEYNRARLRERIAAERAGYDIIGSSGVDRFDVNNLGLRSGSGGGGASGEWESSTGTVNFNMGTGGLADQLPDPKGDGSFDAYKEMIAAAAKMTGVDPTLLAAMVAVESGFRAEVKASTSSATGLGQFINATWKAMLKKHGAKYGIPEGTSPKNPKANLLMTAEYIKDNAEHLKKRTGKQNLRPVDLYMAHFLGPAGYSQFLNAGPNAIGAAVNPAAAKANASIFYRKGQAQTTSQIVSHFEKTLIRKAKNFGVDLGVATDDLIREPSQSPEQVEQAATEPQGLPAGVTASTTAEVQNAEQQAINQPTATPGSHEATNEFSLNQLGSSYSAGANQAQVQMPESSASSTSTPAYTETSSRSATAQYASLNAPENTRAVTDAQEIALQQTAMNDTASKLIGTSNELLSQQLEVQVTIRDTLLKIGDLVAGFAENAILGSGKEEKLPPNGTVPKGQSITRDLKRSNAPFPKPAVSMRRSI